MPKMMAAVVCAGFLFIGSSTGNAAVDTVPKLNTRPSCESPARRLVAIHHSIEACIRSENEAHSLLLKRWLQYSKAVRSHCVDTVRQGGPPSYVELHTCLVSMEHARDIRKGLLKPLEEHHARSSPR